MITIKNSYAQEKMARAGQLLAQLFEALGHWMEPGMNTLAIDGYIESYLKDNKLVSTTKGYLTYKHSSCISVNDEVVHGVPRDTMKVHEGDLIKIDVCASYDGYCADMARSFMLGTVTPQIAQFVSVAQAALDAGIAQVQVGARLSNVSAAIQQKTEAHGYGVVREFAGHGIGKKMHEDPEIVNFGKPGSGPVMKAGMTFAIEPMITMGDFSVYVLDDGWTVKTVDSSLAAHVEDTVLVTDQGPKILTRL
jgi:methionyl aminopeptidase